MADALKNFSPHSISDIGLGDILADQLKIKSAEASKAAKQNVSAADAKTSMSASNQSLYDFLGGGSALDALIS